MKLDAVNRAGGAPFTANPHEPAGGRFAFKLIAAGALCTSAGGQLGTPTERRKIKSPAALPVPRGNSIPRRSASASPLGKLSAKLTDGVPPQRGSLV